MYTVLYGQDHFTQSCGGLDFKFYANGFFPTEFEAYEKLNTIIAEILDKAGNEIVVEVDGANGVLPNLIQNNSKFCLFVNHSKNRSLWSNLDKLNCLDREFKFFSNLSKCLKNFKYILNDYGQDSKISVVFQNFYQPITSIDKKNS